MTTTVLVSGTLSHAPQCCTNARGRFATAKLKGKIGDRTQFWHVVAFSETAQAELLRLSEGDALSVQGALQAEPRNQNAAAEFSLGVVAEHVLPLRRPGKKLRDEARSAAHQGDVRWPSPLNQ